MGKNRETLQALSQSHNQFYRSCARRRTSPTSRSESAASRRASTTSSRAGRRTIESKDAYTLGHCERVADYACALARDVGFDEITMFWFRIGALLHDVGKIAVPSEILNKPGPLTGRRARDHGEARGGG